MRRPRAFRTRSIALPDLLRPERDRRPAAPRDAVRTGTRLADLVFGPTPTCRGVHRRRGGLAPSPARRRRSGHGARQGLHLSRTMLSDQGSPYVGRFACDWHRLPGDDPPGNHRPRSGPGARV